MKKIMVMIAGMTLLFIGCEKEALDPVRQDVVTATKKGNSNNEKAGPYDENAGSSGRKFIDNGIRGHGCVCHAGNCLATVEVKGLSKPIVDEVFDIGSLGDATTIKQYFADNSLKLEPYIPNNAIKALVEGSWSLGVKGYNTYNERFLLFMEEGSVEPVLVIPFTEGDAKSCGS
jgi:hypothetical protein